MESDNLIAYCTFSELHYASRNCMRCVAAVYTA